MLFGRSDTLKSTHLKVNDQGGLVLSMHVDEKRHDMGGAFLQCHAALQWPGSCWQQWGDGACRRSSVPVSTFVLSP